MPARTKHERTLPARGVPALVWGRSQDGRHHRLEVMFNGGGPPGWALCGRFCDSPPVHGEPGIGCVGCWHRERAQLHGHIDQLLGQLRDLTDLAGRAADSLEGQRGTRGRGDDVDRLVGRLRAAAEVAHTEHTGAVPEAAS
jgi:hypothetical protein